LEPIFRILQISRRVTGFMDALARKTLISGFTLSTWKANLLANPSWCPMRIHCSCAQRTFTDEQKHELVTSIAVNYIGKGLFYSDPNFKIDATRFMTRLKRQDERISEVFRHSTHFILCRLPLIHPEFPASQLADSQTTIIQTKTSHYCPING
jgi:hypothetical protein